MSSILEQYKELRTELKVLQNNLEEYSIDYNDKEKELLNKMEDLYFEMSFTERDEIDAENNT